MSPAHKKKSGASKSGNKKTAGSKRVKEVRLDAFRRGANTVLLATILIVFAVFLVLAVRVFVVRLPSPRPSDRSACIELYFYDQALAYLVPIHRRIELAPADRRTERAVHEFATAPRDPSLARVYPSNIPIPGVRLEKGTATVDLPAEITDYWNAWGKVKEAQFLDALTLTVTSAGETSKVRYLIAGRPQDASPGEIPLDKPLDRPKYINQVPNSAAGDNHSWATAFFLESSGKYLFPLSIPIAADADPAMESVKALLKSPPRLVEPPPRRVIQEGCSLDRLVIENGIAKVSLRVPDPQTLTAADDIAVFRRALFLTMKQCCDTKNVTIDLNGRPLESYSRFGSLPDLSQDNCWNQEENQPLEPVTGSTQPEDAV